MKYPSAFPTTIDVVENGLNKREYFAIQILPVIAGMHSDDTKEDHCATAIRYADELIKQLNAPVI